MQEVSGHRVVARDAVTGAILGTLCAVGAHVLGVQQLLRQPGLNLYIPAALFGALLGITRLRPLLWIGAGVLAVLCIVVAYTPLASTLAGPLIRRDSVSPHVDAIAVLSAGVTSEGLMRSETLDRLLSGLSLARRGMAPVVLVSRERVASRRKTVSDSADLQNVTTLIGVPAQIIFVDSIFTTRTEALRMRAVASPRGWKTVAVVTSPLHSRRACATFEAVGFKVVCAPAAVRELDLSQGGNAQDRLGAFRSWLYETFATDSYRRHGWIR
ncbi:MAG TPA: YdcF family protein [Gemmatimonadaceae bacterium]|nr:YdcF family protein [Gemmatimonadaceae bacterium]